MPVIKRYGIKQKDIAKRLHRSPQWVSFRATFHVRAIPELKELLRDGLIPFSTAYELAKNLDNDEQLKRVERVRKHNDKISLEEAQRAGDLDRTATPSKKARKKMLLKAENSSSPLAPGISFALRYVEGLITEEEMEDELSRSALVR